MAYPLHTSRRRFAAGLVAVATVVALSPGSSVAAPVPPSRRPAPPPRRTARGRRRRRRCAGGAVACLRRRPGSSEQQCASYAVPLDYAHPGAGTVQLAVNRLPATGPDRIGSLFLNPGGPGGSGVGFVAAVADAPPLKALRKRFDLVGFDPRGTNASTPGIECEPVGKSVARFDQALGHPGAARTPADALREGRQYAASCQSRSGELLGFMGTEYAARDMDRLRAAVGDEQLSYLGLSYGTYLGAGVRRPVPLACPGHRPRRLDRPVPVRRRLPRHPRPELPGQRAVRRRVPLLVLRPCRRLPFRQWSRRAVPGRPGRRAGRPPAHHGKGADRATTNGYTVLYLLYLLTSSGRDAWPDTGRLLAKIAAGKPAVTNRDLLGPDGGATNIVIECTDAAGSLVPADFVRFARRSAAMAARLGPALAYGPPSYDGANAAVCSDWPVRTRPATGAATSGRKAPTPCSWWGRSATPPRPTPGLSPWPPPSTTPGSSPRLGPGSHPHVVLRQLLHPRQGGRLPGRARGPLPRRSLP